MDMVQMFIIAGGISLFLLLFTYGFIFFTIKGFFFHRLKLFFKRRSGYGEVHIYGDDRQVEVIAANLRQKEVIINRGDHSERYTINPKLIFQNAWDRIPIAQWIRNNPNQLNPLNEPRFERRDFQLTCPDCQAKLNHTAEFKFVDLQSEPKEAADVIDALILRHKLLAIGDWFKKNWLILLLISIATIVAIGVVYYMLAGKIDKLAVENAKILSFMVEQAKTATEVVIKWTTFLSRTDI